MTDFKENWKSYLLNSEFLSKNTVDSYVSDLDLFERFLVYFKAQDFKTNSLLSVNKQDVRSWIIYRKNKGDSAKSISRGISALKNFLKFCITSKLIESSDIISMKSPKIKKSLPRPISIEKINNILDSIDILKKNSWIIKRDKALLVLLYSVGLRINEALSLNKSDIDSETDFINVLGKGRKIRQVPIIDKVRDVLKSYLDNCEFKDSEALFVNRFGERLSASAVQKLLQKSRKLLNLPDSVTPHAFRHSCATHLIESGGDLRSVQELLGHASISSTQIYSDIAKKFLTEVYDNCHPMSQKKQNS